MSVRASDPADRPAALDRGGLSGIHSLFAVLAGMVFLPIYCRRSLARGLGLLAAAVTWVVLANTLRIVTVVYLAATWRVDVASGWSHEAPAMTPARRWPSPRLSVSASAW